MPECLSAGFRPDACCAAFGHVMHLLTSLAFVPVFVLLQCRLPVEEERLKWGVIKL
jgi:hypothetical protein